MCFMQMQRRQEREERQNKGKVQYVTEDVSWIHTSNTASTRYVCWPAPGSRAAAGSLDLRFFFFIGAVRLGGTQLLGKQN